MPPCGPFWKDIVCEPDRFTVYGSDRCTIEGVVANDGRTQVQRRSWFACR
ncbi:hypothetical protein QBC45DRAFT_389473 [Copromyces sp. CBS 386.78]|nr:hypothetical protein QBC45DRAFT_389473 [Copromyces sp. CBS 386.78]